MEGSIKGEWEEGGASKLFSPMKRGQGGAEQVSNVFTHPSPHT